MNVTVPQTSTKPVKKKNIDFVVAIATLGALAFGFDTGVISGALPFMELPFSEGGLSLDATQVGVVTSSLVLGAAFGGLLSGRMSDSVGRKKTLLLIAALFTIGALWNIVCAKRCHHGHVPCRSRSCRGWCFCYRPGVHR